ncbi:SulP family inorganic anion transporter [Salibacteraceae bacterium]|nr:SulP family inorganic anion transporter [Salibacteraceae bacterium]
MSVYNPLSSIGKDLPAGLVVFLVAVPLCLGIALASGAPLFSGIIAGMVGGIVVGALSGSNIGVSGPAAGLAVIVADAIRQLGTNEAGDFSMEVGFPIFLSAVVIAGVMQIVLGFARAGIVGYFFPNAVIKGMLSAIGLIIILKQIPHALGHDVIAEGFDGFWQNDGENTFTELWVAFGDINPAAVIITTISLAILIIWERPFMRKIKVFEIIQGPLVVVALGIFAFNLVPGIEGFSFASDEIVAIPTAEEEGGILNLFTTPDWSLIGSKQLWILAFTIAIVASLETLLCVEATDKLDPDKNVTPTNRELLAQGAGNIVSGFIGGLPLTQVIVRSSANIQSGGRTKLSAILHGLLIAISVFLLPDVLNMIPLSSLAAILLVVGYKLAKPSLFKAMYAKGGSQFIKYIVTVLAIIFTDLLVGISIGLGLGIILILHRNFSIPFSFSEKIEPGKPIEIMLSENVTFLNKANIMEALKVIPRNSNVVIDATQSHYIHPDVIEIIQDFMIHAQHDNIEVDLKGNFETVNINHKQYFMKKVSKDGAEKHPYWKQVLTQ